MQTVGLSRGVQRSSPHGLAREGNRVVQGRVHRVGTRRVAEARDCSLPWGWQAGPKRLEFIQRREGPAETPAMGSLLSSKGQCGLGLPSTVCHNPDLSSLTTCSHMVWLACLAEGGQPCPLWVPMPFRQVLSEKPSLEDKVEKGGGWGLGRVSGLLF